MGLQVNTISFCDTVNNKISKREFTFLNGSDRINRKQGIIINMSNKEVNNSDKETGTSHLPEVGENGVRHEHSQDETTQICKVDLPMNVYGQLVQQALRQGCTPEELVAQQIERIIREGTR